MIFEWPPWLPVISSLFIGGNWLEKADFEKTADYSLLSVLAGEGELTVDGKDYPIQ